MTVPMTQKAAFLPLIGLPERRCSRAVADKSLRTVGLTRHAIESEPGYLPLSLEAVMLETAARSTGERHLGLLLGTEHSCADLGWYAKYVLASPTLAGSLVRGQRALPLISPGCGVSVRRTGQHLVLSYDLNLRTLNGARQLEEGMPGLLLDLLRRFAGPGWHPDWIEMPGPRTGAAPRSKACSAPRFALERRCPVSLCARRN